MRAAPHSRYAKQCTACWVWKRLADFNKKKGNVHGRHSWCRACLSRYKARYYERNKSKCNAKSKRWWDENKERHREAMRRWYRQNSAARKAASLDWYRANRERHLANAKSWRKNHPERMREYRRKWAAANPDAHKLRVVRRRIRVRESGRLSTKDVLARIEFFGGRCAYCGGPYEHLDHVVPLSRGGRNVPSNIRPACAKCNLSKGSKTLREWRRSLTRL